MFGYAESAFHYLVAIGAIGSVFRILTRLSQVGAIESVQKPVRPSRVHHPAQESETQTGC
jgi:hypothetical protein